MRAGSCDLDILSARFIHGMEANMDSRDETSG